jgi:maltose/maltodextrin transport system substrate-binding protein
VKRLLLVLSAVFLSQTNLFAWKNGELLIWMDSDRGRALGPIAKKFENDLGIKVTIDTPQNITTSFPLAAEAGKGPDIVIWAHDKVGEWADAGLIAPVEVSREYTSKFFPTAWQAVRHRNWFWGYPIALETVTLIYNKELLVGSPPRTLSELASINQKIKKKHPGIMTILWDYQSPYYSWGILASDGGYVFGRNGTDYDLQNVGVAKPGAVAALSKIIGLIRDGVLPKSVLYSRTEELMGQGKLAMMLSGPWAWSNLVRSGINFCLAPVPGVNGKLGRPFVGVTAAYLNRSSPNADLAKYFLENYLLSVKGLTAMNQAKPIGVPALVSLYRKMATKDPLVRELKAALDHGEVMPNIPQMGRFFSAVGAALQIATDGQASAQEALHEAAISLRYEYPPAK